MTLSISLTPEIEARLRDQAKASGKDLGTFVREAVEEKLRSIGETNFARDLSDDEWLVQFNQWVSSHKAVGHFVDDSRESIY
jgi:predicted DNA-binding protein